MSRVRSFPDWLWSVHVLQEDTAQARGLFASARACGAARQLWPATPSKRRVSRRDAGAIAISREEAHHSSLLRVRAFPRWLRSAHFLQESTAPARGLSSSARARGAACQLRHATPSKRRVTQAPSLSLGSRRSTQGCCSRAPCRAGCGGHVPYKRAPCQREALSIDALPWCDVQLWPPTPSQRRVSRRRRACARCR